MPWTKINYPDSMKQLSVSVRNKAIEIANAILKENKKMKEGLIISTAIKNAKALSLKSKKKSPAAKVKVKPLTKTPAKPAAKAVVKKQAKTDAKPAAKVEAKKRVKTATKTASKVVVKKEAKTAAKPGAKPMVKRQAKTPVRPAAKVQAKNQTKTPLWPEAKTETKKDTITSGWLETFAEDNSNANKSDAAKASIPDTTQVKPELITHGEDLHFIPVKGDVPPATKFEVRKAENIFHHREEVAINQEKQKVMAALATRKNSKRIYRRNGSK